MVVNDAANHCNQNSCVAGHQFRLLLLARWSPPMQFGRRPSPLYRGRGIQPLGGGSPQTVSGVLCRRENCQKKSRCAQKPCQSVTKSEGRSRRVFVCVSWRNAIYFRLVLATGRKREKAGGRSEYPLKGRGDGSKD